MKQKTLDQIVFAVLGLVFSAIVMGAIYLGLGYWANEAASAGGCHQANDCAQVQAAMQAQQ